MNIHSICTGLLAVVLSANCGSLPSSSNPSENDMPTDTNHRHTNMLINETSPYLLQHAHNPVNWHPWNEATLEKARKEGKLMIISIGYSACHWCHVMEHESFEDEEVAKIMNEYFISVKVDREERPDVDQIYMNAVHLMNQRGGWPLNCFTLPDGRPFYGGTYFQKNQWIRVLEGIHSEYANNPEKVKEYADNLTKGIQQSELIPIRKDEEPFNRDVITETMKAWTGQFDRQEGGANRAPKFPIPNNYLFLLRYSELFDDADVRKQVELTLDKMAYGGIYDQVGGGFARYSTDALWKVPHFEKMLYDNAQLVTLYSEAYQLTGKELYKNTVYQTLEFVERELTSKEGAFYSALDADSEGEEGKFYIWSETELQEVLGDDYEFVKSYYNVNNLGRWEHGNYILLRKEDDAAVMKRFDMDADELKTTVDRVNGLLLKRRAGRVRPGLDDKSLTSWNALMISGYVKAYNVFGEDLFLKTAEKNAQLMLKVQRRKDGGLNHSYKEGRSTINGYLEDYAFMIDALLDLYDATFDVHWLTEAQSLTSHAVDHFYDAKSGMFFFTSDLDEPLIARKMEATDNVIPASNSAMAHALFRAGHYLDQRDYLDKSAQMLKNMTPYMPSYGSGYSNWLLLLLQQVFPYYEIAISGKDAIDLRKEFNQHYIPNRMYLGSTNDSTLPLLENKFVKGETRIYVCLNKSCQLPVTEVSEALKQLSY